MLCLGPRVTLALSSQLPPASLSHPASDDSRTHCPRDAGCGVPPQDPAQLPSVYAASTNPRRSHTRTTASQGLLQCVSFPTPTT